MGKATRAKAKARNRLCPGSHEGPAALFQIRYKFNGSPWPELLGECRHCAHAYTLNNNRAIRAHGFHGCMDGIYVPGCPRDQRVHIDRYEVLREMRLDETATLPAGGMNHDG